MKTTREMGGAAESKGWDHGTHPHFYDYYAAESESASTRQRFQSIQSAILRIAAKLGLPEKLDVADIGCGAGTQARIWARLGHCVRGLDVNEPLINLARQRADAEGLSIPFEVGTATALPWPDGSVQVCLLPELLEHVPDWQACLSEAARVLAPGGLLYVSTTNYLCPVQEEFNLPLYSWYPPSLKRHCERLATTTRPAIANFAKYPAVHWFSFFLLRDFLQPMKLTCLDRFDLMDRSSKSAPVRLLLSALTSSRVLRFIGHVCTPSTYFIAVKAREYPR